MRASKDPGKCTEAAPSGSPGRRTGTVPGPGKAAKWWLPEKTVFVSELPHTAAGKLQTSVLNG